MKETKKKEAPVYKNGQEAMLRKNTKRTYFMVGLGLLVLLVFVVANSYSSKVVSQQLNSTMYLNQYRLGSKTLTASVQAFAATADKTYYNNYNKEHVSVMTKHPEVYRIYRYNQD